MFFVLISFLLVVFGFFLAFFFFDVFYIWLGMEVVSFSVVVYVVGNFFFDTTLSVNVFLKSKVLFKYFFIQMMSSVSVLVLMFTIFTSSEFSGFLVFCFILVKVGGFPSHMWLVDFYSTLSYFDMFLMGFVPKIIPFYLLDLFCLGLSLNFPFFMMVSLLTMLVSVFSSYKSTDLRMLMGFSSMINISWMVFAVWFGYGLFMLVIVYYSVISYLVYSFLDMISYGSFYIQGGSFSGSQEFLEMCLVGLFFLFASFPLGVVFMYKFLVVLSFVGEGFCVGLVGFLALGLNNVFMLVYLRIMYYSYKNVVLDCGVLEGGKFLVYGLLLVFLSSFLFFAIMILL